MAAGAEKFGSKWAADSVADYLGIGFTSASKNWQWWWWERKINWKTVDLGKTRWVVEHEAADGTKLLTLASDWSIYGTASGQSGAPTNGIVFKISSVFASSNPDYFASAPVGTYSGLFYDSIGGISGS